MAEIVWTEESERWLHNIYNYISDDNPRAAKKVIDDIYNKVQLLKEYPRMGHCCKTLPKGEIRIIYYGHYRIGYLIKNDDSIDILGIFHDAMEIDKYLF